MSDRTPPRDAAGSRELRAPWARSDQPIARAVVRPLQRFMETERAGGLVLIAAAAVALALANSPAAAAVDRFWHTELTVRLGPLALPTEDLAHLTSDGLMSLFFFVVGLEIKRQLATGELRDRRQAVLPVFAAVGGMVVPALVYLALNAGTAAARGWGIPMATDVAFALGVLALVGKRQPPGLRAFLLALAIVDDIGAIAVITVVYTSGVDLAALAIAAGLLLVILALRRANVRMLAPYWILGFGVWLATLDAGVHPTIAGAVLGLLTPAVPFQRPRAVSLEAHRVADATVDDPQPPDADAPEWLRLAELSREAVSPLARLEDGLHPWTSYAIVPLFALANAGVRIAGVGVDAATLRVALGVALGLIAGKAVGIVGGTWVASRVARVALPAGAGWSAMVGVGLLGGIGFTVSLVVGGLALPEGAPADAAKVGILAGSLLAALLAAAVLRRGARPSRSDPAGEAARP